MPTSSIVMFERSGVTEANGAVHRLEAADAGRGEGPDRARGDGVDPDAVRAEVGRQVADRRLEGGLGDPHDVVVGDDLLGAVVGERHHARAGVEERSRLPDERDEGVGRDVEGEGEAIARRVDEGALEVLPLGEGEGVDEDVEVAMGIAPAVEDPLDLLVRLDVARLDEGRPETLGERADPSVDEALDRREADRRALGVERLGDAPGDRVVVRHAEDEGLPAVEHAHRGGLLSSPSRGAGYRPADPGRRRPTLRTARSRVGRRSGQDPDGTFVRCTEASRGDIKGMRRSARRGTLPLLMSTIMSSVAAPPGGDR